MMYFRAARSQCSNSVAAVDVWRRMRDDVAGAPRRGHVFTVWRPADSERVAGLQPQILGRAHRRVQQHHRLESVWRAHRGCEVRKGCERSGEGALSIIVKDCSHVTKYRPLFFGSRGNKWRCSRVPTRPGKPGKMRVHLENLEISWNFVKFNKYHGKMTCYLEKLGGY